MRRLVLAQYRGGRLGAMMRVARAVRWLMIKPSVEGWLMSTPLVTGVRRVPPPPTFYLLPRNTRALYTPWFGLGGGLGRGRGRG